MARIPAHCCRSPYPSSLGRLLVLLALAIGFSACATSPTDRRQVAFYSDAEMARQGEAAYRQMQQQIPVSSDSRRRNYVQCVADRVIEVVESDRPTGNAWEVTLFDDEQANAFALPGGKIGVYTGLLDVAENQHQLATVMAHEVGHVIASHSNERASQSTLRNVGLVAAQILGASDATVGLLDQATQLGIFLPFNRTQESEADSIGLLLMARAGFDPGESIALWLNMSAGGGPRPPEMLSTHPSPETRIDDLISLQGQALQLREAALASGRNPDCGS